MGTGASAQITSASAEDLQSLATGLSDDQRERVVQALGGGEADAAPEKGPDTKYATFEGCKLAYRVTGTGDEAVLLHHGMFGSKEGYWDGYREAVVKAGFAVIEMDALGHGESDRPGESDLYRREKRAGHVAAVLDAEGIERAHFVGYSMGGFVGTGMAQFQSHRLLSLTVGGWSVEPSVDILKLFTVDFANALLDRIARDDDVARASYAVEENRPASRAAWSMLSDFEGSKAALQSLVEKGTPLQLWLGKEDHHSICSRIQDIAKELGCPAHEVDGDHESARKQNQQGIDLVVDFLIAQRRATTTTSEQQQA